MRELIFAVLLALAGICITIGAALVSVALAWVVGGVLLAGLAWLTLAEADA